jgi:hypothetical protein
MPYDWCAGQENNHLHDRPGNAGLGHSIHFYGCAAQVLAYLVDPNALGISATRE